MSRFDDQLDAQVRAADLDRWLSSRLVPDAARRADLITLYAFEAELLAIPTRVTQPLLAEMRYTWWSEQIEAAFAGSARIGHPVLEALTPVIARHGLDRDAFDGLITAHIGRVHDQPHDLDAFYVGPARQAARILSGAAHDAAVDPAARVWGLIQTGRLDAARDARPDANRALRALPAPAFPAVAHAALRDPAAAPEPLKRLRLIAASFTGRI